MHYDRGQLLQLTFSLGLSALRYSIAVVGWFHLMVFIGVIMGCQNNDHAAKTEKVNWEAYSDIKKSEQVKSGKKCLLFVYAVLNPESSVALEKLDVKKLETVSNGDEYMTLILKYDDWNDPEIRAVWQEIGHTKEPFLVLYSPNGPPVAFDPFSLEPLKK